MLRRMSRDAFEWGKQVPPTQWAPRATRTQINGSRSKVTNGHLIKGLVLIRNSVELLQRVGKRS